jgi:glycosyltransferase involved in cell wall biosynthesis
LSDVSVIIPCYNAERFIGQTIESILNQTDPPSQIIVIDDGSTDNSAALVADYEAKHESVQLIRQDNAGESKARNVGIKQATGEFVAFLDADDVWMPDKTEKQLASLHDAQATGQTPICIFSQVYNFRDQLDDCEREITEKTKHDPSVVELVEYHWIAPSSAMLRLDAIKKHNLRFEEHIRHAEDMLFFSDVRLAGQIILLEEPLVAKRIHAGQQSSDPWHSIYSLESRAEWVRSRKEQLGNDFVMLDEMIGQRMISVLEDRYWRRMFKGYKEIRERVRKWYPTQLAASDVANRTIHPAWVYKLKDMLSKR